ncbi:hypothetical protein L0B53_18620 (plasmid) [Vibrio sp. SS-MA-C1-2]|uniref:hypothetical protein n=1 Tax=Vibrio sp. SS-MA-C1-2 TaxID=2908646 RepID=UPI001F2C20BA|nr:hypothetical protein [Vibrio sp. SS-MA-C1-2]UJF20336.1 hypothetical protein L0B53_18620 [Vibrio sp. SS-MA-C1-2]
MVTNFTQNKVFISLSIVLIGLVLVFGYHFLGHYQHRQVISHCIKDVYNIFTPSKEFAYHPSQSDNLESIQSKLDQGPGIKKITMISKHCTKSTCDFSFQTLFDNDEVSMVWSAQWSLLDGQPLLTNINNLDGMFLTLNGQKEALKALRLSN